ncbi:hypothetical protein C8R45DRAFT_1185537 [Mycena sanguinolenta]|nr:hypothetical protein C8R45DRAFT_1185537 [Mycena sanguinolenta]
MMLFIIDEYTDVLSAPEIRRYADIVMDALKSPNKPTPGGEPVIGEVAVEVIVTMLELGMDLVDEIWNHPVIHELRRIAVDIVFLDNNIVSYKKELAAGDDNHSSVPIIMHEESTDLSGAMEWVATRRTAWTSQFIAHYKKVPWDDIDAQIWEYVEGIANWPRASDSLGFEGGRYFGSEGLKVQKDRKVVLSRPGSAKFFE